MQKRRCPSPKQRMGRTASCTPNFSLFEQIKMNALDVEFSVFSLRWFPLLLGRHHPLLQQIIAVFEKVILCVDKSGT
eukprot:m.119565 g.119565  ORF g.119565 m.119565 type:complete len:77 (-) comp12909_c0_seq18:148-378(-)